MLVALHPTDRARLESLAGAVGRTATALTGESLAWTVFGPGGIDVLNDQWKPDPALHHRVIEALAEFTAADGSPSKSPSA